MAVSLRCGELTMPTMRLPARTTKRCRLAERRSAAERSRHRVGLKVDWLLHSMMRLLQYGERPSPRAAATFRPSALGKPHRHELCLRTTRTSSLLLRLISRFHKTGTVLNTSAAVLRKIKVLCRQNEVEDAGGCGGHGQTRPRGWTPHRASRGERQPRHRVFAQGEHHF